MTGDGDHPPVHSPSPERPSPSRLSPDRPSLDRMSRAIERLELTPMRGRVRQVVGTIIHAAVPEVRIGELCLLRHPHTGEELQAEVIGLADEHALLTPIGEMRGLSTRTEVIPTGRTLDVPVGPELLGRVLDALGRPLDGRPLTTAARWSIETAPPAPLSRKLIDLPLPVGLRCIDGLLTCGEGQRIGIFGPPGCGKSTLLASIVGGAVADVAVVALIGERGREVREFIERSLDDAGRARSVIVCATSDRPAMERVKAAYVATSIAEYFRDQGLRVLLLMDSVTRFARAQREIGLAAGEPPTRRGFPPSVLAQLPRLMERAGCAAHGSITAFYTVLVEGEDLSEPIAEEVRAVLDGHIILSRKLAGAGHFPAIDVLASASRVMPAVADAEHRDAALRVRQLLGRWSEIELLVQIGEYREGADPVADEAVRRMPAIEAYLRQGAGEHESFADAVSRLRELTA